MLPNVDQQSAPIVGDIREGDVLAGKYRIERVLGAGGMGVVAAAMHLALDERVAIKFLLPESLGNAEAVARFAREARAAVKIKSEHVARVIDVGTLETGAPYMVMEYLEGGDLANAVRARGPLPIEDAVELLLQACEAIAEAHALGIVHRDLKPANLFLTRRADGSNSVKVLDFGISKVTSLSGSGPDMGMTKTTTVMGSPLYMSPEQMASTRDVDARTDIWALGAILFELLSGRVPFDAETMPQLCAMILQHPPPLLRTYRPDAPEGLQRIVLRCLEKDRNFRFTNVAELALALGEFGPRQSRTSVERIVRVLQAAGLTATTKSNSYPVEQPSAAVSSSASTATMSAWGQSGVAAKRSKRKTGAIASLVVAAVLLVGGVAAFVAHRAHGPENPVVTAPTSDTPAPKEPPASPELAKDRPPQAPVPSDLGANNANNATNLAAGAMPAPGTIDAASGKVGRPHDGSRPPATQVTKGHPSPAAPPAVAPPGTSPHAPEPKPPASDLYLDRK